MRRWRWRRGIKNIEEGLIIKKWWRRENNRIVEKEKKIQEGNKIEKGEG